MTRNRLLALFLTFGLPIGILFVGFSSFGLLKVFKPETEKADLPLSGQPVFVVPVEKGSVRLTANEQGEVKPVRETQLSAAVPGQVIFVSPNLRDGGAVEPDEILVRIEPSEYRLALIQARSAVASARQNLAMVEAEASMASKEWKKLGRGEASDLALRRPQLEEARASLAAAIARAEDAALQLERTEVRSPFRGRVRSRRVELGQYVSPGQILADIYATDKVEIAVQLSVSQLSEIGLPLAYNAVEGDEVSQEIEAVLSALIGGQRLYWPGEVVRTGAAIDPSTRLASVYINTDDPFGAAATQGVPLAPGLFVDVSLRGREVDNMWIVPRGALRGNDRLYLVDEADDATLMRIRTVEVLTSDAEYAYILGGLAEGDRVVVSPVQAAFDGMKISVIKEESRRVGPSSALAERSGTGVQ